MKTKLLFFLSCFSFFLSAQNPSWAWAKRAGSSANWDMAGGMDYHTSTIATDKLGNSYITGHFTGTAQFGTVTIASPGYPAVFTAKYDSSGNCLWAKHFGAAVPLPPAPFQTANSGKAIGLDSLGNCYVTGVFNAAVSDTIHFGNSVLLGYDDSRSEIFLVKYDANGNELWATQSKYIWGTGINVSTGISVDKSGNSYMTCYITKDNLTSFGNLQQISGHGSYVVKHNSFGAAIWCTPLGIGSGPPNGVFTHAVDCDENGSAYVTGMLSGTAVVVGTPMNTISATSTLIPNWDSYVAKLNANGSIAWLKQFGHPSGLSFGTGISHDSLGNCIVGGNYAAYITLGTTTLSSGTSTNSGDYHVYFTKLDTSGNVMWAVDPLTGVHSLGALKTSHSGDFYFAAGNQTGLLVGKCNALGTLLWQRAASGSLVPAGLGLDANEDVYIAGNVQANAAFAGHTISSAGGYDVMLAKVTSLFTSTVNVGFEEMNAAADWMVYPNPFETEFFVKWQDGRNDVPTQVRLYNLLGEEVTRTSINDNGVFVQRRENLPKGIYMFTLYAGDKVMGTGKIIAN